jgi:hypothetical protein
MEIMLVNMCNAPNGCRAAIVRLRYVPLNDTAGTHSYECGSATIQLIRSFYRAQVTATLFAAILEAALPHVGQLTLP